MKIIYRYLGVALVFTLFSCSDFLDAKNDKKLTVPSSLIDLEAILNHVNSMNSEFVVSLGEVTSDNYYLTENGWTALLALEDRAAYIWDTIPVKEKFWPISYSRILNSNVVLQQLDLIKEGSEVDRKHIKGAALYYRAASFFDLLQIYSRAYEPGLADDEPGIVLRMSATIDEKLYRASQEQCMQQVEVDLLQAVDLLKDKFPLYPTQASKVAALGMLSRFYLMKRDFIKALEYAEKSLNHKDDLLDYNKIPNGKYGFEKYNPEVIFFIQSDGTGLLSESRGRVHPDFYVMYNEIDRRKELFFTKNADGYHAFTGDYANNTSSYKFTGLTTSEMLLTRAECHARLGSSEKAIEDMIRFMNNRYSEEWIDLSVINKDKLLKLILDERRKELVFRGLRWFDLRRLTKEESGVERIVRDINNQRYSMTIEEIKAFRFRIPQTVTDRTGMRP